MKNLLVLFLLFALSGNAQKVIEINNKNNYIKDAASLKYSPGDTLLITESISNFGIFNLSGAKEKPVVITAKQNVIVGGYSGYGMQIYTSKFFKVTGINIKGHPDAISIKCQYSSDMTFENINIDGGTIGLQIKSNPEAGNARSIFPTTINNVVVRNVNVKNTSSEGFYLGHTFDAGLNIGIPAPIIGLTVENCTTENSGWDGFQVTNAQNCVVNNISVKNAGTRNQPGQRSGITLQDATTGIFTNLKVDGSVGSGLTVFGNGKFIVKDVLLNNTDGIFVDNRPDRGLNLPQKQLEMENITLSGKGAEYPILVYNGTLNGAKTALPGTITNLVFDKTKWGKISDNVNIYLEKTAPAPSPVPVPDPKPDPQPQPAPQPDPVKPVEKKVLVTIKVYDDGSTEILK